ncbi:hypothetical protein BDZ97DRAFT_1809439 [Flammula alnicola]|nr:hypothetical protein BDZ97DRAFT_1809439 [Flammula alnicola]
MSNSQWKLDQKYAKTMENHPFGIALYRPPSLSIFKPGIIGYFDAFGSWNIIADLEDHEELLRKGLSSVEDELVKAPRDNRIKWGPKVSSNTKTTKIELSAGIDPAPGIPVTASAVYSYHIDSDVGAILLTTPPITHERYYHTTPFKTWMKKNALVILEQWPDDVKNNSLWVITSTFSTKKCAINMWTTRGRGYKVGFSAEAMGLGQVGPSANWYRSSTDEGWGEYTSEDDDRSVVFFGGLKFNYTQRFRKTPSLTPEKPAKTTFRGPVEWAADLEEDEGEQQAEPEVIITIPDSENEDMEFEVDCEEYLAEDAESY